MSWSTTMRPRKAAAETPVPWGSRAIDLDKGPQGHLQMTDSHGALCLGCGTRYERDDLDEALFHATAECTTIDNTDDEELLLP